jgi:hypothetical protein
VGFAQVIVLQVAVAILVDQITAFGACCFRDQNAGEREPCRVVLDELHVLERRTSAVGERHTVTVLDRGVRRERKHPAAAARTDDDGTRGDRFDLAGLQFNRHHALDAAVVDKETRHEPFVVAHDAGELERGLKQGVKHVEAGLVGGEPRAHLLHAAERAYRDPAIALTAPRTPPVLEAKQLLGRFRDERVNGILVARPVAAGDGVIRVFVEAVVGSNRARSTTLRGHCVAPHRVHLRHDGDLEARVGFRDGNGRAQTGTTAAHQHHIMRRGHALALLSARACRSLPRLGRGRRVRPPVICYSAYSSSSVRTRPSWRTTVWLTLPSWYSCWIL